MGDRLSTPTDVTIKFDPDGSQIVTTISRIRYRPMYELGHPDPVRWIDTRGRCYTSDPAAHDLVTAGMTSALPDLARLALGPDDKLVLRVKGGWQVVRDVADYLERTQPELACRCLVVTADVVVDMEVVTDE